MSISKFAVAIAAFTVVAGSAFAGTNVVGAWKGKLKFNLSKLPPSTDPQRKAMLQQQIAMASKVSLGLVISKNGTFAMKISGAPTPPGGKPIPTQTGTWTLKGNQLSLVNLQFKAAGPQVFTISKDGKSFTIEQGGGIAVTTFTR